MRFIVKGSSMEPTFREGERIFASSLPYVFKNPREGDIVVLLHPFRKIFIIKRIKKNQRDGKYIVVSDNPLEGECSASFGVIKRTGILGKVLFKY